MRYLVFTHGYGRPIVKRGPAAGCANFPTHHHTRVTSHPVGLARAKMTADLSTFHAMVYLCEGGIPVGGPVHDNGKPPYTPEGWFPEQWRGGRE